MTNPKTFAIALLIIAAATLPLKAAEQCCQPCPNGVLVGVTADSCGTCVSLASFIPGCTTANATACTACKPGYYLSGGTCTPCNITLPGCTACSNANTCTTCATAYTLKNGKCTSTAALPSDFVIGMYCGYTYSSGSSDYTEYHSVSVFQPHCIECWPNSTGCKTCGNGRTLINNSSCGN